MNALASDIFSVLSIISYIGLYFPQIMNIYKKKTSDNISLLTLFLWSTGDTFNLVSVKLLDNPINLLIIGFCCSIMTYILFVSVLAYKTYRDQDDKIKTITMSIVLKIIQVGLICFTFVYPFEEQTSVYLGNIFIWIYILTIVSSKFPQIYKNYKQKNIVELSVYLYIFSAFGNIFYLCSIVVYSQTDEYIQKNLSWITSVCILIVLDFVIIAQCILYKNRNNRDINIDEETDIELVSFDF